MELCMQDVGSIDVPAYSSKFELLCHAEAERLEGEAEAWIRARAKESGLEDKEGKLEKLIATKLVPLSCQFWPHSLDPTLTLTLVKIMHWFFIFDNIMDEPHLLGADAAASQQFCGFVLQAFFTMDSSQALVGLDLLPTRASRSLLMPTLLLTLVAEWWPELRAGMSARQQARFCSHFADYVLVHARQARFKEAKAVPGVEDYLRIRLVGTAVCVVEMLAEQDCGIELDEEDLRNPSVRRLNEAIALHTGLLNDYVGFAHEYEQGDYFNILTVLHCRNNLNLMSTDARFSAVPFHKAAAEAWEMIAALEEECVAYAKAVQEWALMHSKPGLLKYVASLCSISAANWLFTVHSTRFTESNKHCVHLQVAENDLHTFTPKCTTTRIFLTRPTVAP
nr:microbial terpene synthase-like protein 2 [Dryopteris fragrans]